MVGGDDSTLSFLGLFIVSKPFHQIISFNPTYSMRSSMPFPIYLRRLRFREVNPEITLLVKKKTKQHWGRSRKTFQEITTLFDFLLNILKEQDISIGRKRFMLQRPVSSLCIRRPWVLPAFVLARMTPSRKHGKVFPSKECISQIAISAEPKLHLKGSH